MKLRQARKIFYTACGCHRRGTALKAVRRYGRELGIGWWTEWAVNSVRRIEKRSKGERKLLAGRFAEEK